MRGTSYVGWYDQCIAVSSQSRITGDSGGGGGWGGGHWCIAPAAQHAARVTLTSSCAPSVNVQSMTSVCSLKLPTMQESTQVGPGAGGGGGPEQPPAPNVGIGPCRRIALSETRVTVIVFASSSTVTFMLPFVVAVGAVAVASPAPFVVGAVSRSAPT